MRWRAVGSYAPLASPPTHTCTGRAVAPALAGDIRAPQVSPNLLLSADLPCQRPQRSQGHLPPLPTLLLSFGRIRTGRHGAWLVSKLGRTMRMAVLLGAWLHVYGPALYFPGDLPPPCRHYAEVVHAIERTRLNTKPHERYPREQPATDAPGAADAPAASAHSPSQPLLSFSAWAAQAAT